MTDQDPMSTSTALFATIFQGGELLRYPAFRWVFPIFYFFGTALFVGLLVYQLAAGGHP